MTPEQLREIVSRIRRAKPGADWEEAGNLIDGYAAALEELASIRNSDVGMLRAQMQEDLADFDAMKARAERAESALAEAERKIERLKGHAEAMAETLDKWAAIDQCKCSSVDAYRAEFKE